MKMAKQAETLSAEQIRDISVEIYKMRLEANSSGAFQRMIEKDGSIMRGRAGAYDDPLVFSGAWLVMTMLQYSLILALIVIVGCGNMLVTASWGRSLMNKLEGEKPNERGTGDRRPIG